MAYFKINANKTFLILCKYNTIITISNLSSPALFIMYTLMLN